MGSAAAQCNVVVIKKPNDKEDVQNSVWCDQSRLGEDIDVDDGGRHHNHYLEEKNNYEG